METRFMSHAERRIFWGAHVKNWRESGQSKKKYCEEHGLKTFTLSYWCSRIPLPLPKKTTSKQKTDKGRLRLVPIKEKVAKKAAPNIASIQIQFRDCTVAVAGTVNETDLSAVIRVLRSC